MRRRTRWIAVLAVVGLIAAACGGEQPAAPGQSPAQEEGPFTIGVSNTLVGNQWREQMVCAIKAQARVSGKVDRVILANRDTDATGQIADIEGLISQGVDAIIVNPADRTALDDVIKAATDQGILVIAVDQAVTAEEAFNVTNDQVAYAEIGARWLFEQLDGSGSVVEMRGFDGHPADTDRHKGFEQALADFPDIEIVRSVFTGWDPSTGAQQALDIITTTEVDGIWTSGIDYPVVEQFQTANEDFVPIVGADNNGFIEQLINLKDEGLVGAAVTNPPPVGGVATAIAIDLLTGAKDHPKNTLLEPQLFDNVNNVGELEELHLPDLPQGFVSTIEIEPWTTYTAEDVLECKGPGE